MGPTGPEPDELRLMRRVALAMLAVGSVVCGLGPLLKDLTPLAADAQAAAALGFALIGAVAALTPPRRRTLEAAALASVVLLCVMVGTSNVIGMTPFFFLWPCVYLAYFAGRRATHAGLALMAGGLAVAVALNPYTLDRADTFTGTVSSVGLMTALVAAMTRRERALRDELAHSARTDALTGVLNRRGLEPELEALLAAAVRRGRPLAVLMVDLDHFKCFNDRHGHLAGDEALRRLAAALSAAAGDGVVARFGGEEFTVVLPGCGAQEALDYADGVARLLRAEVVAPALRVTVSAGIATVDAGAQAPEDAGALLRRADLALYAAKAAGRDCARLWHTALSAAA